MHLGVLRVLDRDLLTWIQSVVPHALDPLGSVVTVLGHSEVTAGIAAGLVVARLRARRSDFWVPLFIALIVLIEFAGKHLVAQPVPPHELQRDLDLFHGITVPLPFSFPSGHVARDTFLLLIVNGWARVLVVLGIALVALTRVYTGQHWPSDVLGGLLLGAGIAWAARSVGAGARRGGPRYFRSLDRRSR